MSKLWPVVTKSNPCPICGKGDWCAVGDRAYKCMRVESENVCESGGWYHFRDDVPKEKRLVYQKREEHPPIPAGSIMREWFNETTDAQRHAFASSLGVHFAAILSVGAAWARPYRAWAFPMFDGYGDPIGIRLRALDGKKWAVPGSRNGIFLPKCVKDEHAKTIFVCEGPTDLAAALTLGIYAIGRPSCNSGNDYLKVALQRLRPSLVVFIGDDDKPGEVGADAARKLIKFRSIHWTPPAKDLRAYLNAGGNRAVVESSIGQHLWINKHD